MENKFPWQSIESEILEFHWSVFEEGYRLAGVSDKKNPKREPEFYVSKAPPLTRTSPVRVYQPMAEYPALYHEFAEIDFSKSKSIIAFVNQYGFLTKWSSITIANGVPTARGIVNGIPGVEIEPLALWVEEIKAMRFAVEFWELVQNQHRRELSRVIRWEKNQDTVQVTFQEGILSNDLRPSRLHLITSSHHAPLLLDWFAPGDVFFPARYYLTHFINAHLFGHVTMRLLWTPSEWPRLKKRNVGPPSPDLRVVPCDLLGTLWLQLAQIVAGERYYQRCKNCGKLFLVGDWPATFRTNRKTCSDACRTAACRKEGKEKLQLHQRAGLTKTKRRRQKQLDPMPAGHSG